MNRPSNVRSPVLYAVHCSVLDSSWVLSLRYRTRINVTEKHQWRKKILSMHRFHQDGIPFLTPYNSRAVVSRISVCRSKVPIVRCNEVKRRKKTVAFPHQVSYKVNASEDVPLAWIKVCILRKSTRVSQKVPGFMSGPFF